MKKEKNVRFRHRVIKFFAQIFVKPILKFKFKYKYSKVSIKNKGPYLILCNHQSNFDPLLMSLAFDRPIYLMASEQIFNLGFVSKLITYAVNPISKSKSLSDVVAVKKCKRIINEGGSVGIFPEGNVTYTGMNVSMPKQIVKLIRFLNVPIMFYNIHGMSLSTPRWSIYNKKASSYGKVKRIMEVNEYKDLSDDELFNVVKKELLVDTNKEQIMNKLKYKGKNLAESLERLLFICPKCHEVLSLHSHNNTLKCDKCSFLSKYTLDGFLEYDNKRYSLWELEKIQKELFLKWIKMTNKDIIFSDEGVLFKCITGEREKLGICTFSFTKQEIIIINDNVKYNYRYEGVLAVAIQGKHKLIIYPNENFSILIDLDNYTSPYKYLLTYQYFHSIIKNKEIQSQDLGL